MNTPDYNNPSVGKVFIELQTVDSTNEHAKQLLSKSKPVGGTVIFTHEQTAGKGQFGKKWESNKDENLTFSVILYPDFIEASKAHRLNQVISLALHDFFQSLQVDVTIKWPNDIYHGDNKLCGILVENALMKEHLSYSIVGIGINVNQTSFSPDIPNATSLKLATGREFELIPLLRQFFPFLEQFYERLRVGQHAALQQSYQSKLYKLNELKTFKTANETFEGITRGIDHDGRLIIEVDGKLRYSSSTFLV